MCYQTLIVKKKRIFSTGPISAAASNFLQNTSNKSSTSTINVPSPSREQNGTPFSVFDQVNKTSGYLTSN